MAAVDCAHCQREVPIRRAVTWMGREVMVCLRCWKFWSKTESLPPLDGGDERHGARPRPMTLDDIERRPLKWGHEK